MNLTTAEIALVAQALDRAMDDAYYQSKYEPDEETTANLTAEGGQYNDLLRKIRDEEAAEDQGRWDEIRALVGEQWPNELIDIDGDAIVSEGEGNNGAYVAAWVWVDFSGTDLDKGDEE